jgi:glycosyltransferase involved in cell wall biosynthesis
MRSPGLVSVIIPTYNRFEMVRRAVDGALSQTYRPVELVVVDDSTDGTREQIRATYGHTGLVHVVEGGRRGSAAARRRGVARSVGEYVAFLDSDDWWKSAYLEDQVERMRRSSRIGLAWTAWQEFDDAGARKVYRSPVPGEVVAGRALAHQLFRQNAIHMSAGMLTRRAYDSVGGFAWPIDHLEDLFLWIRVCEKWDVGYTDRVLAYKWSGGDQKGVWPLNEPEYRRDMAYIQCTRLLRRPGLYLTRKNLGALRYNLRYLVHRVTRWIHS